MCAAATAPAIMPAAAAGKHVHSPLIVQLKTRRATQQLEQRAAFCIQKGGRNMDYGLWTMD